MGKMKSVFKKKSPKVNENNAIQIILNCFK